MDGHACASRNTEITCGLKHLFLTLLIVMGVPHLCSHKSWRRILMSVTVSSARFTFACIIAWTKLGFLCSTARWILSWHRWVKCRILCFEATGMCTWCAFETSLDICQYLAWNPLYQFMEQGPPHRSPRRSSHHDQPKLELKDAAEVLTRYHAVHSDGCQLKGQTSCQSLDATGHACGHSLSIKGCSVPFTTAAIQIANGSAER